MAYEIRDLTSKDIFPLMRIISKIGVGEFKSAFENVAMKADENGNVDLEKVGVSVAFDLLEIVADNLPKAEKEIYAFLASVSNLGVKQIEEMPPADFLNMIADVIRKREFADFFTAASKLVR